MEKPIDIREDEEQGVKLQETMELLVAAGYFRARIKGLQSFDKVVGGMIWCLEICNLDIDIDLLFQESLSIGQKIALTEKIVAVLPQMQCPHRLDPHQIQGLDFVHIFPVVQWLVKKAIETREETGDSNRAYAIRQFEKKFPSPESLARLARLKTAEQTLQTLGELYAPKRKYRRKDGQTDVDFPTQVRYTLLEYGFKPPGSFVGSPLMQPEKEETKQKGRAKVKQETSVADLENENFELMMGKMEQFEEKEWKFDASTVGNIVGGQAEGSAEKAFEEQERAALEGIFAGGQFSSRSVNMKEFLSKQLEDFQSTEEMLVARKTGLEAQMEEQRMRKRELKGRKFGLDQQNAELSEATNIIDEAQLEEISSLLLQQTELEEKIGIFRTECKKEAAVLRTQYQNLKQELESPTPANHQLSEELKARLHSERETVKEVRLRLAQRNREVAQLQRALDDTPSQAELLQYQRRFVELYDQVAAKLRETKKYYTLYNTLSDTKMYYEKEVQLLESIHDNFETAMASDSAKEQFNQQLEQILESLRQTASKAEKRRQNEKLKRDQLNDKYLELMEKQRLYHKLVKEFQQECARNEALHGLSSGTS